MTPFALIGMVPGRVWLGAGLTVAVALAGWKAYSTIYDRGAASRQPEITAAESKLADFIWSVQDERDRSAERARESERKQREEYEAVAARLEREKQDAGKKHDAVVADLRAGAVRLQRRFTCPAATAAGVPGAAGAAGIGHGADGSGFTREDAEVALGIARAGDDAIRQLTACQDVIRSWQ